LRTGDLFFADEGADLIDLPAWRRFAAFAVLANGLTLDTDTIPEGVEVRDFSDYTLLYFNLRENGVSVWLNNHPSEGLKVKRKRFLGEFFVLYHLADYFVGH